MMLGLLMVFILPGFAVVRRTLPGACPAANAYLPALASVSQWSHARPCFSRPRLGLSRVSLAVAIGVGTIITSICAWFRTPLPTIGSRECVRRD